MARHRVKGPVCLALATIVLSAALSGCAAEDQLGDVELTGKADGWGRDAVLSEELLAMARGAAELAQSEGHGAGNPDILTIVDYSLSSAHRRLWVINTRTNEILFNERVAHGRNSGNATYATSFSNVNGSNQSSLGLFEVNERGVGGSVGNYVAVDGLEPGWNGNARRRQILIHGAPYASDSYYRSNGYTGRSLGCLSVRPDIINSIRSTIRGGSLLFVYYPDEDYLRTSDYVTDAPMTPWVGTLCEPEDDGECDYSYGSDEGRCYDDGGFCVLDCEGVCPDRYGHAETFCVENPSGGGMCVSRSGPENNYCEDLPGALATDADRYVGDSGAAHKSARVCLP